MFLSQCTAQIKRARLEPTSAELRFCSVLFERWMTKCFYLLESDIRSCLEFSVFQILFSLSSWAEGSNIVLPPFWFMWSDWTLQQALQIILQFCSCFPVLASLSAMQSWNRWSLGITVKSVKLLMVSSDAQFLVKKLLFEATFVWEGVVCESLTDIFMNEKKNRLPCAFSPLNVCFLCIKIWI